MSPGKKYPQSVSINRSFSRLMLVHRTLQRSRQTRLSGALLGQNDEKTFGCDWGLKVGNGMWLPLMTEAAVNVPLTSRLCSEGTLGGFWRIPLSCWRQHDDVVHHQEGSFGRDSRFFFWLPRKMGICWEFCRSVQTDPTHSTDGRWK